MKTMTNTFPRLVADIGGTNARFAWVAEPGVPLTCIDTLPCAAHASLVEAVRHYLKAHGLVAPRWCAAGIAANSATGDQIQMTNNHWSFSISEVQRQLGLDRLLVLNDFTALALSLPALQASDLRQIGGGSGEPEQTLGLIGPGTGLGVSGLVPMPGGRGWVPLRGEGGHVTLAATNEREERVIAVLQRRFGHASAERAVSGQGIENLHQALCELDGQEAPTWNAADIAHLALEGKDKRCVETIELFFSFLGTVAGNLALTLGARGGLYIGGGIVPRLGTFIERSRFRACFESKGRFRNHLEQIPTYLIQTSVSPALMGAANALNQD